jgi:thioredoxin-dependent peroxiredoxin
LFHQILAYLTWIKLIVTMVNSNLFSQLRLFVVLLSVWVITFFSTTVQALSSQSASSRRAFVHKIATATTGVGAAIVTSTTISTTNPVYAAGGLPPSTIPPPVTGSKAPDFELRNSRGSGATTLQSLIDTGKWTVLYFYPGAFTKGCTLEARYFQRDIDNYRSLNAQIVGVSVDPPEKNDQFCTAEGLDFFMLSDTGGRVSKLYGSALSVPGFGTFSNRQTYIIDPKGNLRWVFVDVESRIPTHSSEVLDKLKELEGVSA